MLESLRAGYVTYYRFAILRLAAVADVAHVSREHLEGFLSDLDARGLSGNYRRRKIAAVRSDGLSAAILTRFSGRVDHRCRVTDESL